jgi:CRISPR-associated Csx2 family protein
MHIYMSFLGLGSKDKATGKYSYTTARYRLNNIVSAETPFVQAAEIEILKAKSFGKVVIMATEKSKEANFPALQKELRALGVEDVSVCVIGEDMSAAGQWRWFEQILDLIYHEAELTVDLTHGYRAMPIVFSNAINFLQRAKKIRLKAVYYGAFEMRDENNVAPIIDMKDFFVVNEWADAVSRLTEDADARKLASVARSQPGDPVAEMSDAALIESFEAVTDAIRNVDAHGFSSKANIAVKLTEDKLIGASSAGKLLLNLVIEKFKPLVKNAPLSGCYDNAYFRSQLAFIELLLEHRLYMQAFTCMRELIGSIGLVPIEKACTTTAEGRKQRGKAEVFTRMIQFPEEKWKFEEGTQKFKEKLLPYYNELQRYGLVGSLRAFAKDLTDYRNGFDHAWTAKPRMYEDIAEKGDFFLNSLRNVIRDLVAIGMVDGN